MRVLLSGWIVLSGMMSLALTTISAADLRLRMDIPNRIAGQAARIRNAGSSRTLRIVATGCGCGSVPRPMTAAPCQSQRCSRNFGINRGARPPRALFSAPSRKMVARADKFRHGNSETRNARARSLTPGACVLPGIRSQIYFQTKLKKPLTFFLAAP